MQSRLPRHADMPGLTPRPPFRWYCPVRPHTYLIRSTAGPCLAVRESSLPLHRRQASCDSGCLDCPAPVLCSQQARAPNLAQLDVGLSYGTSLPLQAPSRALAHDFRTYFRSVRENQTLEWDLT